MAETTTGSSYFFYIWLGLLAVMIYFMSIRPQQQEQRRRAEMLRSLNPGDKVISEGGLVGVITKVEDNIVRVRVAEKTEVEIWKTKVARVLKE